MTSTVRFAAAALVLLCAAVAQAADASTVLLELQRIDAEFDAARARCDDLAGQAKDVCLAEVRADRRIRKAELAARGQGTSKARYDAQIARAEAEFGVAKERCAIRAGSERAACVADARADEARAKDEARRARHEAESREVANGDRNPAK
jgi:hypothetical protein